MGIFLAKLRGVTVEQLCAAVHRLDETVLQPDLLEALGSNLPSEPEAKQLRALKPHEVASLPPVEHFCWEMARVPRLRSMLDAMRLRQSLPFTLERATSALVSVSTAAREVMASTALRQLLAALLAHGNFLNADTPRGGAMGFKLDGLEKARAASPDLSTYPFLS